MNLLKDGIAQHTVEKTTLTRKLTLDGLTKAYPVYKVRLDQLFYNEQNDRIATWISQYRAQHDGHAPDASDREHYNAVIEKFIVDSNPDAIRKTQNNIEMVDQREPGVVLADGRIIDGNRRFTCLRELAKKNDRFGYFEAVILDRNIESSAKQIKLLELSIQHGEENKVDYNPIDRLVGVYNDIIATGLLSVEEYARSTNETEGEVRKRVEVANLMVEFLEFINAPKQFYIARDLQLYYPLEELLKLIKKCSTVDEAEDLKNAVFTNILMQTNGDMTRFVRHIKSVIGTEYQDEFLQEQQGIAAQVIETLPPQGKVTTESLRETVRSNTEAVRALERSMDKALTKAKKTETKNRPILLAEKATTFLEGIDTNILAKLNDSELQRLKQQLSRLEDAVRSIREYL
jgi:hypothetical protein